MGNIYRIECPEGYYYIGSTTRSLTDRLRDHRKMCKRSKSKFYNHMNLIGWSCVKIVLIEECDDDNLHQREDVYIRSALQDNKCLNQHKAYRSLEEKKELRRQISKKYRDNHKEEVAERERIYRTSHREQYNERKRLYKQAKKNLEDKYHEGPEHSGLYL